MNNKKSKQAPGKTTRSKRPVTANTDAHSRPSLLFQRSLGNRMTGASSGQTSDRFEKEADTVAANIADGRLPTDGRQADRISRLSTAGGAASGPHSAPRSTPDLSGIKSGGQPLPANTREHFESLFGANFESVRIHSNAGAGRLSDSINANAFTYGNDIVFADGQYAPSTGSGMKLLSHELTHNIQQVGTSPTIQMKPSGTIGANDIFPFAEQSLVLLNRAVPDWIFVIMSKLKDSKTRQIFAALQAVEGEKSKGTQARVTASTADLFVATAVSPVTIPAVKDSPARTVRDLTVRLSREGGSFTFSVTAIEGQGTAPTPLMEPQSGLTATREDRSIVLSSEEDGKSVPQLRVVRDDEDTIVKAFTANISPALAIVKPELSTISISQLQAADENTDVQAATNRALSRQTSRRRTRRQRLTVGGGATLIGGVPAGLVRAAWMYRFPTTGIASWFTDDSQISAAVGQLVHIPLEVQILYAPPLSFLGTVATGVGARIPLTVPVNVSLLAGVGGGSVGFPTLGVPDRRPVFGPTLGGTTGIELGTWRIDLRADHLFNRIQDDAGDTTSIWTFSGNVGGVF